MNDDEKTPEEAICGSGRVFGSWHLDCELPPGHEKDGTWHQAHITERRETASDDVRHVTETTETVTWAPGSLKKALLSLLGQGRGDD